MLLVARKITSKSEHLCLTICVWPINGDKILIKQMFNYYLFSFKRRKRSVQMTNEDKSLCSVWKLIRILSEYCTIWYFSDKIYKIAYIYFSLHLRGTFFKTSTSYCHCSVPEHVARDAFTCNKLQTRPLRDKFATFAALLCRIKSHEKRPEM